jgi:hypothetical protein
MVSGVALYDFWVGDGTNSPAMIFGGRVRRAQMKENLFSKIRRVECGECGMRIEMLNVYKRVKVRTSVWVSLH